ncbi:transposase [Streptomyces sp. NPDC057424]|uniref:transposase n=1 Tax=Streptomyces sp. NPDC057424 TaxID=3346127 RepID=UPI0036B0F5AD
MSLHARKIDGVPEETARVVRAAFPKGSLTMRIRDELGELFSDADFTALYPNRGKPAWSPARLALVSVMQSAEGLSDRRAADAVRGRLDWKYSLGPELADPAGPGHGTRRPDPGPVRRPWVHNWQFGRRS